MESNSCSQEKKEQRSWTLLCLMAVVIIPVIITAIVMLKVVKPRGFSSVQSTLRLDSTCNVTSYPARCYETLLQETSSEPKAFFKASLVKAVDQHEGILGNAWKLLHSSDEAVDARLKVCEEMIIDSVEYLNETIELFDEFKKKSFGEVEIEELRKKLSFVIVDHETCMESLEELDFLSSYKRNMGAIRNLTDSLQKGRELVSNSLAIVNKVLSGETSLLDYQERAFPQYWFGYEDEKTLLSCQLTPNVTVAGDGSGDYKTIGEAVASVPEKSSSRFVIYVKAGVYKENVNVRKHKDNIVMYGDGNNKTVVSGSLNKVDNPHLATYQLATFSVSAKGFLVRDMKFENTAGPEKNQAVAFHSQSSRSVMYRCRFHGYQDTLYAHSGTQFYRDCEIIGTVDFIFGAATAVFQNCYILPREPLLGQKDTVTAQSATHEIISSFSIINCTILPFEENGIRVTAPVYLGRPWQNFSRVVVMRSVVENITKTHK